MGRTNLCRNKAKEWKTQKATTRVKQFSIVLYRVLNNFKQARGLQITIKGTSHSSGSESIWFVKSKHDQSAMHFYISRQPLFVQFNLKYLAPWKEISTKNEQMSLLKLLILKTHQTQCQILDHRSYTVKYILISFISIQH